MKPDEPYTYQDFMWASSQLLTQTLPPEYKDWSDDEWDDFVDDNRWEPFEHHPTNEIIDLNGAKIVGNTNLPGELPYHSSQVYSSNIFNLIDEFWNEEEKQLNLDITDEILSICLVSHEKEYINKTIKEIIN